MTSPQRTAYAIRRKGTGLWLALPPSLGTFHVTTEEPDACAWDFMSVAELERLALAEYADAYEVVPVSRPQVIGA